MKHFYELLLALLRTMDSSTITASICYLRVRIEEAIEGGKLNSVEAAMLASGISGLEHKAKMLSTEVEEFKRLVITMDDIRRQREEEES